jgi:hypothetical protein
MYNIIITMSIINNIPKLSVFLLIISIVIIIILYYVCNKRNEDIYINKRKSKVVIEETSNALVEGFNINDIGKIIDDVKEIGNVAKNVTGEIKGIGREITNGVSQIENTATSVTNQIDKKLDDFGNILENKILDKVTGIVNVVKTEILEIVTTMISVAKTEIIGQLENMIEVLKEEILDVVKTMINVLKKEVFDRIAAIFAQIPGVLNNAIVNPLNTLFTGIKNIFLEIFKILRKIGFKIVSLPSCILYYFINGIVSSITGFLSWLTPSWIEKPVSAIWNATIGALLSWVLDFVGYNSALRKCIEFDVDENVNNMEIAANNIADAFTKDFGKNIKFKI